MARNYRMVFHRSDLLVPVFAAFLSYSAISCLQPVLPLYISGLVGAENAERATGLAAGLQGLAGTVAAFSVGRVTTRFGFRPVLTWAPALMIGVFIALWAAEHFWMLLAMLMLAGVIQGLSVTTLTSLIALRAPREAAGATFGVVSSINSFAFSGAPLLSGTVASAFGLRAVFPLCALLAGGMLALSVRAVSETGDAVTEPAVARPRESTSR
jgi:MFS family permease